MKNDNTIGGMIKRLIKCRNRTEKMIAEQLGIKYTTFSAQLINNTVSAETLFRLSAYLDIDLNWMMVVLGYHGPVSALERELIPRMQSEFRKAEKEYVLPRLDCIIGENPNSTADARRELIKEFHDNLYYLLDVLVPEEFELYMVSERGKNKYYVDTHEKTRGQQYFVMRRKPISWLKEGNQALDIIIEERKER